jgi:inhibitor of KinA
MLGFLPGFAYLGKVSEELFCHRKKHPRLKIPTGSVGLAGYQTGIYPAASPGGWQIIGQCPIPVFDFNKEQAFLFEVGDQVKFEAIDLTTFKAIKKNPQDWKLINT